MQTGSHPPADTGESVGLAPSRVTVTFGLGPGLFRSGGRDRFGLAHLRPAPLVDLPHFATDSLQSGISGGDLAVQICADDPQVAFHALHDMIRLAQPVAMPRWALAGFGRTGNAAGQPTPRNLLGFKDGTANMMSQEQSALKQFVWASGPASPAWMQGGSYLVVRRIETLLARLGLQLAGSPAEGRSAATSCPGRRWGSVTNTLRSTLSRQHDGTLRDPVERPRPAGQPGLQQPTADPAPQLLLCRWDRPTTGSPAAGLLFLCYQRDPGLSSSHSAPPRAVRRAQPAHQAHRQRDLRLPARGPSGRFCGRGTVQLRRGRAGAAPGAAPLSPRRHHSCTNRPDLPEVCGAMGDIRT